MKRYIIVETKDLNKIDFSKCMQSSVFTVRFSANKKKAILKYTGDQPEFVYNITNDIVGLPEYTHNEILQITRRPEWRAVN